MSLHRMVEGTGFSTDQTMQQAISLVNSKIEKNVDCYFYHNGANSRMTDWEDTQIDSYIDFWPWKNIIECNDASHKILTQLFYANMEFIDEPWSFTILTCGQPIIVTISQLVK
jgi:hypothetical protein